MSANTEPMTLEHFLTEMETARPIVRRRVWGRYRDNQLSDEVTHDCLTDAWNRWQIEPTYFVTHNLLAWTTQRAYWRVRDRLNDRARFAPLAEEHPEDPAYAVKTHEAHAKAAEPEVERHQVWALVHEAVTTLSEDDREIIDQHHFGQMTDKAIGDQIYGVADSSRAARGLRVFRRRTRIEERLRECLLERGYDPQTGQAS
ncbi:MAG: sigma-70 family RNA polymerase sigma factor [Planctomycetia bacterium]|nr:sigma-70 family RNA polymerase sigma factor [Planctomycetia bacterium]